MIFASTNKNKEVLKMYTRLWDEIKNQFKTTNGGEQIEYRKDFIKMRFESADDLPLSKISNIPIMVTTGFVFQEGNKYYAEVLLHECVYKSVDKL